MRDDLQTPIPRSRVTGASPHNHLNLEKWEQARSPPPPSVQRHITRSQESESQRAETMEEPPRQRKTLLGRMFGTNGGRSKSKETDEENYQGFMLKKDSSFSYKRKDAEDHEQGFEESRSFRGVRAEPRPPSMSLHPKQRKPKVTSGREETEKEQKDEGEDDEHTRPPPPNPRKRSLLRTSLNVVVAGARIARPPSIEYREYKTVKKARGEWDSDDEEEEEEVDLSGMGFFEKMSYKAKKFRKSQWKKLHEKFMAQRALFCFLAVSLLWITSLGFCVVLLDIGLERTNFNFVKDSIVLAVDTAAKEGEAYESCVLSEATSCRLEYELDYTAELARVKKIVDTNTAILDTMASIRDSCATNNTVATKNLRRLIQVDNLDVDTPPENIGTVSCSNVSQLIVADLVASQAYDVASATALAGQTAFDGVQAQLLARASYDLNFLGEKTGISSFADLEQLLVDPQALFQNISDQVQGIYACVSDLRAASSGDAPPECRPPYAARLASQFQDYRNRYNETVTLANEYKAYVDSAINTAIEIANYIAGCAVCVAAFDLLAQPDPFDALSALTSILCPNCDLAQRLEEGIANTEKEIKRQIEALVNKTEDDIKFAQTELTQLTDSYKRAQQDYIDSIFGDYDPPVVDNDVTDEEYRRSAEQLSDKVADTLEFVPNERPDPDDVGEYVQQTEESAASLLERVDPREYDLFVYGGDLFGKFEAGFGTIADLIITYDLVYRVIQSFILIRKYWTVSNINTPPADIRPKRTKGTEFKAKQNPVQLLARILTHPASYLIIFTTGTVLSSLALYTAYEPFYSAYVSGCIEARFPDIPNKTDGTMLYRNGLTFATTYSFSFGDRKIKEEIDAINVNRTLECREQYDNGFVQQTAMRYVQDYALNDQIALNERYNTLDECLDFAYIDAEDQASSQVLNVSLEEVFGSETCKLPLNVSAIEATVGGKLDLSDEMLYNCSNIDQCLVTRVCGGPKLPLLKDVTFKAACVTEWYLHGLVIYFVASIVVFTVLNVSRYYLMLGLVAVWWRNLSNTYSYWAACDVLGRRIDPEGMTEDKKSLEEVISHALKRSLRSFQRLGYVYVFVAVALNFPWIIGLIILSENFALDI